MGFIIRLFQGMAEWWWTVEMTCIYLGDFCWEGGSNAENWDDHRKKNLLINSVELSMCDGPIESVKYIWVNILYMVEHASLDFLTNLQKITSFANSWSTSEE